MSPGAAGSSDPFILPQTTLRNRVGRMAWNISAALLFRPSPRPMHAWRAMLLRAFGARLGRNCHIYARARIWAPWNLTCGDVVAIADDVEIYNAWPVVLDSHATISQQAYLCAASHDMDDPRFPMIGSPIHIGRRAWVCARATVLPGVTLGEGAVLATGAVATKNIEPWSVHGGVPARRIRERQRCA